MAYKPLDVKTRNTNYLGRDFSALKSSLIEYAKSYFPNSYKDFNEASSGMMLIEMSAYVGDVLNFYIDQQFQEMLLPLSKERKNVITLAKTLGYKVKASIPAYTTLKFTQTLTANNNDVNNITPEWSDGVIIDSGLKVVSSVDPNIIFETLDVVDFQTSGSGVAMGDDAIPTVSATNQNTGLASQYSVSRRVRAVQGETKAQTAQLGSPKKFLKITLNDTDITEIIDVIDGNGNKWYEVDYLAQDKVPRDVHYTSDSLREPESGTTTAYHGIGGVGNEGAPVPYSLEYIATSKRFVVEVDEKNQTQLVFGNGIIRNGQQNLETALMQSSKSGVILPGPVNNLQSTIDPLLVDDFGTLGEIPSHTTLTIRYRKGIGTAGNVGASELKTLGNNLSNSLLHGTSLGVNTLIVNNEEPATGGAKFETLEEIRQKAISNFTTQARCVTKEDYEARILSMPSKYGGVAKVFVERADEFVNQQGTITSYGQFPTEATTFLSNLLSGVSNLIQDTITSEQAGTGGLNLTTSTGPNNLLDYGFNAYNPDSTGVDIEDVNYIRNYLNEGIQTQLGTIKIYLLGYDSKQNLIGEPYRGTSYEDPLNPLGGVKLPKLLMQNLKQYLNQYRILTDQVTIQDGFIINFGVVFDVVAQQGAFKSEVKFRCINILRQFFAMKARFNFRQPLYTSDLEFLLMSVTGVRAVNYVTLTQKLDYNNDNAVIEQFGNGLYDSTISAETGMVSGGNNAGYGYQYDFGVFYNQGGPSNNSTHPLGPQHRGIILPSVSPSVFELKNPDKNIIGVVR